MYKIIGADQKEYGPVNADQVRQWIAENRLDAQSSIQAEGSTEWRPLSTFPEFADALAARAAKIPPPPAFSAAPGSSALPADILSRDYHLEIGSCISDSWNLFTNNFGVLLGGAAIYFGIAMACSLFAQIPIIGLLGTAASLLITGPLAGGLLYMFLKAIRRQPVMVGDVFFGFQRSFLHLFLAYIVMSLLTMACFMPAGILTVVILFPSITSNSEPNPLQIIAIIGIFLLSLIPVIYLATSWMFTLPLVIDKGMNFWPAMETSRKVVGKHWWTLFGFSIVLGLIALVGILACCVGLLFAMPIACGALMYAYERIFSSSTAQTA